MLEGVEACVLEVAQLMGSVGLLSWQGGVDEVVDRAPVGVPERVGDRLVGQPLRSSSARVTRAAARAVLRCRPATRGRLYSGSRTPPAVPYAHDAVLVSAIPQQCIAFMPICAYNGCHEDLG